MNGKTLLIPLAAFAVSVTGVSAFNSDVLEKAGLTEEQISAFEAAKELREEGDREAARAVLINAGIDMNTMESVREAMHAYRHEHRAALHQAVENNDFEAFKVAVANSPLADIIVTEEDFAKFRAAHELKEVGDRAAAEAIFEELGLEHHAEHHPGRLSGGPLGFGKGLEHAPFWDQLSG